MKYRGQLFLFKIFEKGDYDLVNKPGEKPAGGTYKQVGPRGGKTTHAPIHHKPGKPLPPTEKPGQGWKKV